MNATDTIAWELLGMSATEWSLLVGIWIVATAGLVLLNRFLVWRFKAFAERTRNVVDDYLAELFRQTKLVFLAGVGLYIATRFVEVSGQAALWSGRLVFLLLMVQVALWINRFIAIAVQRYKDRLLETDPGAVTTMQAVGFVGRFVLYTVILLLALENFDIDVTALIASLGIVGIAIALALQKILGDLFGALAIVLDKPFMVGDFLVVGESMGTVEKIGLKTTRLRSLSGEQLIFSNSDLLSSRIHNFKRMYERRIVFTFGVTYQTPPEKLEAIPAWVREIIEAQEQVRFDRSHFKRFDDSALLFETVYFVLVPDFNTYMDIQQAVNLALFKRLAAEEVEFAYPTRTLYVEPLKAEVAGLPPDTRAAHGQ